jgi:hypothetical protein
MAREMKSDTKVTLANRRLAQPHNAYNIYFMLERYKLIHDMEGSCGTAAYDLNGYDLLTLPDLPPGFQNLQLPLGWFVPGKNSKRKHNKTHGRELFYTGDVFALSLWSALLTECLSFSSSMTVTSFAELARRVSANWKSADKETKDYCVEVARIIKARHAELTKVGVTGCLSTTDSVGPRPTEEAKPRNADNENKDTELCLPTMDSVSPGPKNDTKRRGVQLPRHAFGDQPSQQYLRMHAPVGIFPVAHGQDTMNSRDISRTWLMDMLYHQYHHSQASTTPNATTMWGNDSLNRTNINMLQPIPLDVFQNIQLMTGSAGVQIGTDHQDVTQEFRAIMNASRRETISSMMTLPGSALGSAGVQIGTDHQDVPQEFRAIMNASRRATISSMVTLPSSALMPEGIRCFGEQPSPNSRWYSAPDCQSFEETHTELTTPVTEGIRCLGEQPSPNNMWYSAPEYQSSSELDRSRATYEIQELDVTDSNILGMWRSSKVQETDEI